MDELKYQCLGVAFQAYENSVKSNNNEWKEKWGDKIDEIINSLPHGSGIDGITKFDFEKSKNDKLVINSEFHFMDQNGFYDGWGNFKIIIKPDWRDFSIEIKGSFPRKYQDIKDYLYQTFEYDLMQAYEIKFNLNK